MELAIGARQITPANTGVDSTAQSVAPLSPSTSSASSSATLGDESTAPTSTSRTAASPSPKPIVPISTTAQPQSQPFDPIDLNKRADDIIARLTSSAEPLVPPQADEIQRRANDVISRIETEARAREVIERLEKQTQAPVMVHGPGMVRPPPYFGMMPGMMMPQMMMGPGGMLIPVRPMMPGMRTGVPPPRPNPGQAWRLPPPRQASHIFRPPVRPPPSLSLPAFVPRGSAAASPSPILSVSTPDPATPTASSFFGNRPPPASPNYIANRVISTPITSNGLLATGTQKSPNSANPPSKASASKPRSPDAPSSTSAPLHSDVLPNQHYTSLSYASGSKAQPPPDLPYSSGQTPSSSYRPSQTSARSSASRSERSPTLQTSLQPARTPAQTTSKPAQSPAPRPNPQNQIYLGSLPSTTSLPSLRTAFESLSPIVSIELRSPYAMIEFEDPDAADRAVEVYDEGSFDGAMIRVERAVPKSNGERPTSSLKRPSSDVVEMETASKRAR